MVFTLWVVRNDMYRTASLSFDSYGFLSTHHFTTDPAIPYCLSASAAPISALTFLKSLLPFASPRCQLEAAGCSGLSRARWCWQGSQRVHRSVGQPVASQTEQLPAPLLLLPFFYGDAHLGLPSLFKHQFSKKLWGIQCLWDITASF